MLIHMCLVYNIAAVVHNLTLGLATGRVMDLRHVSVPPNLAVLLQLLLDVHGYEIFQVGCFNGDPHPGNVLLMPDGRLGLIDYGSCVSLALEHRQRLARVGDSTETMMSYTIQRNPGKSTTARATKHTRSTTLPRTIFPPSSY